MISIALVSHNNQSDLEVLLPSLMRALRGVAYEILLIDNCSVDTTVSFVQQRYPEVLIHRNVRQLGYGANQNLNIARAKGKYIVLMNPDIVLPDNVFLIMMRFMATHDDAGMATCEICNEDGSCQFLNKREPALLDLFIRRFVPSPFHPMFEKRLQAYEMRDEGYDHVVDVPFMSGAFMFARTRLIREIGGFDERFFMYFEDVDLTKRVRMNARALYCPDVKIVHQWRRASQRSLKWTWVFIVSAMKYYHKWGVKLM